MAWQEQNFNKPVPDSIIESFAKLHMYRESDIELRMKIVCSSEIYDQTLVIDVNSLDAVGGLQGSKAYPVNGASEMDKKVPIFSEFSRVGREEFETMLKYSVSVRMPPINMDQGALLIEFFELYIHDCKRDIQGHLCKYKANYSNRNFTCQDLEPDNRVSQIFFGYQPFGSIRNHFISKSALLALFITEYNKKMEEAERQIKYYKKLSKLERINV